MSQRNPLIYAAAILFFGFSTVAAYQAFKFVGLAFLLLITVLFALSILLYYRSRLELIDEMEVGVIFNRFNNSFCRFVVSPKPTPRHNYNNYRITRWIPFSLQWLKLNDPYFVRLRWHEKLEGKIPKRAQTASGKLENVRTADGIPITISWKVSYKVNVDLISEVIKYKMAHALPEHSGKIVSSRAERAIKHLVELRSIKSLYEFDNQRGPGIIQGLEEDLCQRISRQLSHPVNLGFEEFKPKEISLGPIVMPAKVEKALELAHQRKIQTEMVARAMERLQRAVSGFSAEDVRRLSELERLRILDDKEIRSLYLSDAFVGSESMNLQKKLNSPSQQDN